MSEAECFKSEGDKTLSSLFDDAFELHDKISNSCLPNSDHTLQDDIVRAVDSFEEATRMVSLLGIFSRNEIIEEISTDNLKYFLLPVLLGNLTLRRDEPDRLQVVNAAKTYFKDFLRRCYDYTIVERPEDELVVDEEDSGSSQPVLSRPDLAALTKQREIKTKRYKEQKHLEDQLKVMRGLMKVKAVDEELQRRYYTTIIKKYINTAVDELDSIKEEVPILHHVAQMKGKKQEELPPPKRPLKPIILTRDVLQKQVFGLGYPSIPTMTIEEFARKHLPDAGSSGDAQSMMSMSTEEREKKEAQEAEQEEIRKEKLRDKDDPETLKKAREWDEFKDEHKRGEGNRANKS